MKISFGIPKLSPRDRRHRLIGCLMVGLSVLLLAACGGKDQPQADSPTPPAAAAEADSGDLTAVATDDANDEAGGAAALDADQTVADDAGGDEVASTPAPALASATASATAPETPQVDQRPSVAADQGADGGNAADSERPLDNTTNILILGSDRRDDTPNWRTDVLMIVALDREHGRAGVISIPRDLFIDDIPGHEPNRINVVDYLGEEDEANGGGPALLARIIEERMGIPIHHYLRFSFDSFREVVDALGGVDVDIDCEFRGFIEDEGGWLVLEPGMNRLSGNQAMIYVRDRQLTGGDLNRARRQQRFVWAVRNQVLDENLLPRLPALYSALSGSVDTDIGLVTTLRLARTALEIDPADLYGTVLGPPEMAEMGWAMGMSVFLPRWDVIAQEVQRVFERPPFVVDNTLENCQAGIDGQ